MFHNSPWRGMESLMNNAVKTVLYILMFNSEILNILNLVQVLIRRKPAKCFCSFCCRLDRVYQVSMLDSFCCCCFYLSFNVFQIDLIIIKLEHMLCRNSRVFWWNSISKSSVEKKTVLRNVFTYTLVPVYRFVGQKPKNCDVYSSYNI